MTQNNLFDYGSKTVITIKNNETRFNRMVNSLEDCLELSRDENHYIVMGDTDAKKKPTKADIKESHWAWVDIDIGEGNYQENRNQLMHWYLDNDWDDIQEPTMAQDSGGGIQLFWAFDKPLNQIDNEAINRALIRMLTEKNRIAFNPDKGCWSYDHLMRCPNTINVPNDKKLAKGYPVNGTDVKPVGDIGPSYDPDDFPKDYVKDKAIKPLAKRRSAIHNRDINDATIADINPSEEQIKIIEFNYLKADIPSYWRSFIDHFEIPTVDEWKPTNTDGYSEYIFAAIMVLAANRIYPQYLAYLCLNEDYKWSTWWSSKDLTQQASIERINKEYAKAFELVNKDKDDQYDGQLSKMNEKYAILDEGNNFRVIREDIKDSNYVLANVNTWAAATSHLTFKPTKGKEVQLNKAWLKWNGHRSYQKMVYKATKDHEYELWKGYDHLVSKEDYDPKIGEMLTILFNKLIRDDYQRSYFLDLMAYWIKHPEKVSGKMPLLYGNKGTGKSFIGYMMFYIFGNKYATKATVSTMLGNFSSIMAYKPLVFLDEMDELSPVNASRMKDMVTAPTIVSEAKFAHAITIQNYSNFIGTIDSFKNIYGEPGERRTFLVECSDYFDIKTSEGNKRFTDIKNALGIKGLAISDWSKLDHITRWFLDRDISKFNINKLPSSKAMEKVKADKYSNLEKLWYDMFEDEIMNLIIIQQQNLVEAKINEITADMIKIAFTESFGELSNVPSTRKITEFMRDILELEQTPNKICRSRWLLPSQESQIDMNELKTRFRRNIAIR